MSDENLNNELDKPEIIEESEQAEAAETVETAEETEVITAEPETEEASEPKGYEKYWEDASEGDDDEETDENGAFIATDTDDEEDETAKKSSKKTTAVLVSVILVLVAVIAIFAVMLINKVKNERNVKGSAGSVPSTTASGKKTTDSGMSVNDPASGFDSTSASQSNDDMNEFLDNNRVSVTLGQYKGIEATMVVEAITEEDIQNALDDAVSDMGDYQDVVDRPCDYGDYLSIDYVGWMDGEQFEGGTGSHPGFTLGSGAFIPGFEDAIVGLNVGETVTANMNFPENYGDKSGLPVTFDITVTSIKVYTIPELTDELIAQNTAYETVDAYREFLANDMADYAYMQAENKVHDEILKKVVDGCSFDGDVTKEVDYYVDYYRQYYAYMANNYYGIDLDLFYQYMMGVSGEAEGLVLMRQELDYSVRLQYVLDEIAKQEAISVSADEYDAAFEYQFLQRGGFADREEVLTQYTEEQIDETVNNVVRREKAENLIYDTAIINK